MIAMNSKNHGQISFTGVILIVLTVFCLVHCKPDKPKAWELFNPVTKNTIPLLCNADSVVYVNQTGNLIFLRFDVVSQCEFSGRVEKLNARDSTLAVREVKGYASGQQQKIEASFELEPGEKFYVNCQGGTTVNDLGCVITWWLVAEKK
jgi:hypothetical protein